MAAQIDRYVARLVAVPFAATIAVFAMLLLLVRMAELISVVIEGGGTALTMLRLLAYLAPQYLAMAIPVGLVAGVVLAFRRLALSGEWDALSSAGISLLRLLRVPLMFGGVSAACVFVIAAYLQPLSVYAGQKLLFDLSHGADGISITPGAFVRLGDDLVVRAQAATDRGRDLRGVLVSARDTAGRLTVISAARAVIEGDEAHFFQGTVLTSGEASRAMAFGTMSLAIPLPPPPDYRARGTHERELIWNELWRALQLSHKDETAQAVPPDAAWAGIARRVTQSGVLIMLPFLAVAFARPPLRSSDSSGLFVALAGFIIFNELSLFAERLGFGAQAPPVATQAGVLVLFAIAILVVFARAAPRPVERSRSPIVKVLAWFRARRTPAEVAGLALAKK